MDLNAAKAGVTFVGGSAAGFIKAGNGNHLITTGGGGDTVILEFVNSDVNTYTSITDVSGPLSLQMVTQGYASFNSTKVVLANTAVFQDYANVVIATNGDASSDAALGWFQYNGDTWLVESLHDATNGNAGFENGVDAIVKLNGLVDLSGAVGVSNGIFLPG